MAKFDWGAAMKDAGGATGVFKNVSATATIGGVGGGAIDAYAGNDSSILDGVARGAMAGAMIGGAGIGLKSYKVGSHLNRRVGSDAPMAAYQPTAEQAAGRNALKEQLASRRQGPSPANSRYNLKAQDREARRESAARSSVPLDVPAPSEIDNVLANSTLSLVPKPVDLPPGVDFGLNRADQRRITAGAVNRAQRGGFGY